jgi:hypothetical protein
MKSMILGRAAKWTALLLLAAARCGGAEPLPPPLELQWGGSPTRLMALADRFGMDKTVRTPGKEPRIMILQVGPEKGSIPGHEASMVEARFIGGRLYEVAVHYTYPGRKTDFVKARFIALKKGLTAHYGRFQFDGEKKTVADGITRKSESYHLQVADGRMLLLAITEVKDVKRGDSAATFSVVYHNAAVRGAG